jgi:hypothetical protein
MKITEGISALEVLGSLSFLTTFLLIWFMNSLIFANIVLQGKGN